MNLYLQRSELWGHLGSGPEGQTKQGRNTRPTAVCKQGLACETRVSVIASHHPQSHTPEDTGDSTHITHMLIRVVASQGSIPNGCKQ